MLIMYLVAFNFLISLEIIKKKRMRQRDESTLRVAYDRVCCGLERRFNLTLQFFNNWQVKDSE